MILPPIIAIAAGNENIASDAITAEFTLEHRFDTSNTINERVSRTNSEEDTLIQGKIKLTPQREIHSLYFE